MRLLKAVFAGIGGALLAGCSYLPANTSRRLPGMTLDEVVQKIKEKSVEEFVRLHPVAEVPEKQLVAAWLPGGELERSLSENVSQFEIKYGIFENLQETAIEFKGHRMQFYSPLDGMTPEEFYLRPGNPEIIEISKADVYLAIPRVMSRAFEGVPLLGKILSYAQYPTEVLIELKDGALDYMTWELYESETEEKNGYSGSKATVRIGPIFQSRLGEDEQRQFNMNLLEVKLKFYKPRITEEQYTKAFERWASKRM